MRIVIQVILKKVLKGKAYEEPIQFLPQNPFEVTLRMTGFLNYRQFLPSDPSAAAVRMTQAGAGVPFGHLLLIGMDMLKTEPGLKLNRSICKTYAPANQTPYEAAVRMTGFLNCHSEESPGGKPVKNLLTHFIWAAAQ